MSRELLQNIIDNFDLQKLKRFFSIKNSKFHPSEESFDYYNTVNFSEGLKLGELFLDDGSLIVCAFKVKQELSERSGKKMQYELGKKILKEIQFDAGIFIFYNQEGIFRFSLIYANYLGKKRDWSTFRRFTYFVKKDLTNKTFKLRIGDSDFSSLKKIKDVFSVEKVTNEFYQDIANWYFWAVQYSVFPKDAEEEENGRNIAIIRLITRMIFIWFMRERGLIPKDLFNWREINNILKDISPEKTTYYLAILQNLFFATLNTKRNFCKDLDSNQEEKSSYGERYGYRYYGLFKDSSKLKDYFGDIPFLNGGLFECLDDKSNGIIIDGFSDNQRNQPKVPNKLFFSEETEVDLNIEYGTENKSYKVRGLIDTLSSYNFTIDENELDDQEVALDPELLGRVFENLLASFNPETSTTARRATGSYYTHREIVDYMIIQSLKTYFKSHLLNDSNLEKKIELLFSKESEGNNFDKEDSKKIVELIETVKIVDPAVGSGAFPMGALNKLVFILNKVDPGNELWKQAQLSVAENIPDPRVKQYTKNRIEDFFKDKNADYGRKLYLIQKCIYGVDIQQTAVEIAKLRFFISLLVEEKIDKNKDNWGIEPLPNLDFKIMQGDSLISEFMGINFDNGQEGQDSIQQFTLNFEDEDNSLIKDFEQKKIEYQNESDKDKKFNLKNEVENSMIKIFESKIKRQKASYFIELEDIEKRYSAKTNKQAVEEAIIKVRQKLSHKIGFDLVNIEKQLKEFTSKKKIRSFFPWKLYFAEVFKQGGFDIVLANPPYVDSETMVKEKNNFRDKYKELYSAARGNWDLYIPFLELGFNLLKDSGVACFITPNKWYAIGYGREIRKILEERIIRIGNCNSIKVFEAGNSPVITLFQKAHSRREILVDKFNEEHVIDLSTSMARDNLYPNFGILLSSHLPLLGKINSQEKTIGDLYNVENPCSVSEAYEIKKIISENSQIKENLYFKLINTGAIDPFVPLWGRKQVTYIKAKYDKPVILKSIFREKFPKRYAQMNRPKIIISGMRHFESFLDLQGEYIAGKSTEILMQKTSFSLQLALGLLNSTLIQFYIKEVYSVLGIDGGINFTNDLIDELPFPDALSDNDFNLEKIVNNILLVNEKEGYSNNLNKQSQVKEYKRQIDQMVYKLYKLTPEEIEIVENLNKK